jgi:hypothetical protein
MPLCDAVVPVTADQLVQAIIVIVLAIAGFITRQKLKGKQDKDGPNGP